MMTGLARPCYTFKMKSILTLILLLTFNQARALDAQFYPCEIKDPKLLLSTSDDVKQWFLLLGLTTHYQPSEALPEVDNPSFENQYWRSLNLVKSQVKNCDQALAFWQRFGRSIERYFDETPPTEVDLRQLGTSVLSFELDQRQLLRPNSEGSERTMTLKILPYDEVRPWWRAEVAQLGPANRQASAHYSPDFGPLGALTSYEILRQWREKFEFDFWHHDSLINQEQYEVLSTTFTWAKPLFDLLRQLPERYQLSIYLGYILLSATVLGALWLLWAAYLDWLHVKQK